MITQLRQDVKAAIEAIVGSSVPVIDEAVQDFERENLRELTVIMGPAARSKTIISRNRQIDDQAQMTIGVMVPLVQGKDETEGSRAHNTIDAITNGLFKQKTVGGGTGANVLGFTDQVTTDADQWRQARQASSVCQMLFGVYT